MLPYYGSEVSRLIHFCIIFFCTMRPMPPALQRHGDSKPWGVFVSGIVTLLLFTNLKQPVRELGGDTSLLLQNTGLDDFTSQNDKVITFQDLELLEIVGSGDVSMGFKAKIRGRDYGIYIAKITGDYLMRWSDNEIQMFRILNSPPTIPNIPQLEFAVSSMPNPYTNRTYLESDLGIGQNDAKRLMDFKNVSILVMQYLGNHHFPKNIQEIRVFMRSLLHSLHFAHSRNIMLCDLHTGNVNFDGEIVKLFDWNGGFFYQPEVVKMHYNGAPNHLMPPEAWNDENAVHVTVSGFDIWSAGLMMKKFWDRMDSSSSDSMGDSNDELTETLAQDFLKAMLTKDPTKRPDAGKLLQHPFLAEQKEVK